jgi:hypothetical protein
MEADLEFCPGCEKETKTILGRCPNCGFGKDPGATPAPTVIKGSFWEELEGLAGWGLILVPGLVLAIAALIWLGTTALLIVVLVLVLVSLAASALDFI